MPSREGKGGGGGGGGGGERERGWDAYVVIMSFKSSRD